MVRPNCCVPYCHSHKENPSSKGISYHEFPVNEDVRAKWLQNIHRKKWTPADRSVVCSQHFLPEDYKPGIKTKYLKNGAIPTVFTKYPFCLQAIIKKTRIKGDVIVELNESTDPPLHVMEDENSCSELLGTNGYEPVIITDNGFSGICLKAPDERVTSQCDEPGVFSVSQKPPVTLLSSTGGNPVRFQYGKRTFTRAELRKRMKTDAKLIGKFKSRYRKAKKQLLKLRQIRDNCRRFHKLPPNRDYFRKSDVGLTFAELKEDAANGSDKAAFLLDQVANYKKVKPHWSESTLKHSSVLFQEWPNAYDYSRHSLLQLPVRSTVRRFNMGNNNSSNTAEAEVASKD